MLLLLVLAESLLHERALPLVMPCHVATGRRSRSRPAGVMKLLVLAHVLAEVVRALVPRALVLRLFLAPDDFGGLRIAARLHPELLVRERIELLDANDGRVFFLKLGAFGDQVVVDLAAAGDDPPDVFRLERLDLGNHGLERAVGELLYRRGRFFFS